MAVNWRWESLSKSVEAGVSASVAFQARAACRPTTRYRWYDQIRSDTHEVVYVLSDYFSDIRNSKSGLARGWKCLPMIACKIATRKSRENGAENTSGLVSTEEMACELIEVAVRRAFS